MNKYLKSTGNIIIGILGGLLIFVLLPLFLIYGGVWIGNKILPILAMICLFVFLTNLIITLPMSFIKKLRELSSVLFLISSYVFGLTLWFESLVITFYLWGLFGVIVGLGLMGIGVLPIALFLTVINGHWLELIELLLLLIMTALTRWYSYWLAVKAEKEEYSQIYSDIV